MSAGCRGFVFAVLLLTVVVLAPAVADDKARGASIDARDPTLAEEDGTYYLLSSGAGLPIHTSTDLETWTEAGRVFADVSRMEAPTLAKFGGAWHLYYVVAKPGTGNTDILHAISPTLDPANPGYGFTGRQVVLSSSANYEATHPHVSLDNAGRPWLVWGSGAKGVFCTLVDPTTGALVPDVKPQRIASGKRETGAACVVRHGEYHYLLLTAGKDHVVVGRSPRFRGPYEDYGGRSLRKGGGTLLLARDGAWQGPAGPHAMETRHGMVVVHQAFHAATQSVALAVRPMLWPGDGWPVLGPAGSMRSWGDTPPERGDVVATWMHSVDFAVENPVAYLSYGQLQRWNAPHQWTIDGNVLELRWPRNDAPGGVWVDRCVVSSDARYYVGRNQAGMVIRGRNRDMSSDPKASDHGAPVGELPSHVVAPEGKLTLYADFPNAADGRINLYLVNRTQDAVLAMNMASDLDVYLYGRLASAWERAQPGGDPMCGMGWSPRSLRSQRFFRITRELPADGVECAVRFRIHGAEPIDSNEGPGRVRVEDVAASRVDHLAVQDGDLETVAEIATGKRTARDPVRHAAIRQLARFDTPASVAVLLDLLDADEVIECILVMQALSSSGEAGKAALPALRTLLEHSHERVRAAAERAVAILEHR